MEYANKITKGEEISEQKPPHIGAHVFLCGFQSTLTVEFYLIVQTSQKHSDFVSILHITERDFEDVLFHNREQNKKVRWHQ